LEAAREILKTGINLNRVDEYDLFPLWHASDLGYTELVGELLDAGADPNFTATGGSSALQTAALHCKLGNI
jgi:ankyrin repeat protein